MNYYIPKSKNQLVDWLHKQYPQTRMFEFKRMDKKQLYAIYYDTVKKYEVLHQVN